MKFSVRVSDFYNCLEIAEKALPTRSTISMLNNIHFEARDANLFFYATNLEIEIKTSMPYEGSDNFSILLPPKIVEIMRYFPTEEAQITCNHDSFRIDIEGGSAAFNIYGADPADYPKVEKSDDESLSLFKIKQAALKKLLKMVIFAVSTDETRPAFNGILFHFNGDSLKIIASDTYRMAINEIRENDWDFEEQKCLVPARALREVLRLLGDDEQNVSVVPCKNKIEFEIGQVFLATRLLEEKYPDLSSILPKEYKTRFEVERKIFEETVFRAALLAEGKNQAVKLGISDQKITARVASQQGNMEELINVETDGDDVEVLVNTRYMLDFLKNAGSNKVRADLHGLEGPLVFRPADGDNYLYLVLPIKKV